MSFPLYRRMVGFKVDGGQTRWGRVKRRFLRLFVIVVDLHTNKEWVVRRADIHTTMPETY